MLDWCRTNLPSRTSVQNIHIQFLHTRKFITSKLCTTKISRVFITSSEEVWEASFFSSFSTIPSIQLVSNSVGIDHYWRSYHLWSRSQQELPPFLGFLDQSNSDMRYSSTWCQGNVRCLLSRNWAGTQEQACCDQNRTIICLAAICRHTDLPSQPTRGNYEVS